MEAGTENSSIETLRDENEALRKELEWTRAQHDRWREERNELVSAVRELRAKVASYEPEPPTESERAEFEKLKAWAAELQEANRWYGSQESKWADGLREAQQWSADLAKAVSWHESEYQQLKNVFDEQKNVIAELEKAREWYKQQISNLEQELQASQKLAVELEKSRGWFAGRRPELKK